MSLPESVYRDLFAQQFNGLVEVRVPFGRVDVVATGITANGTYPNGLAYSQLWSRQVVEVEPVTRWQHAVRQALAYSAITTQGQHVLGRGRFAPAIALYGQIPRVLAAKIQKQTQDVCRLFLLDGTAWCPIPDRSVAKRAFNVAPDAAILSALETRPRAEIIEFPRVA